MSNSPNNLPDDRGSARLRSNKLQAQILGLTHEVVPAVVLDESFGGLGVAVPLIPETGIEVEVIIDGLRSWAIVRYVTPLPSGARVGLEWKAQALSRRLRELIENSVNPGQSATARFGQILPGGLSMLWKLFEAQHWLRLRDSAERLRKEAAVCGVTALTAYVERLIDTIEELTEQMATRPEGKLSPDEVERIERLLNRLIDKAVQVVLPPNEVSTSP